MILKKIHKKSKDIINNIKNIIKDAFVLSKKLDEKRKIITEKKVDDHGSIFKQGK